MVVMVIGIIAEDLVLVITVVVIVTVTVFVAFCSGGRGFIDCNFSK